MSVNSSSKSSIYDWDKDCIIPETKAIILSLLITYIFTTPLFVFVLVVGFQKWRKQRSSSSFTTSSHIDVFTYNVVVLDLLCILGNLLYFFGIITNKDEFLIAGSGMFTISSPGQMLFHLITCVELYLAVVHPVFYLRLRGTGGVRIRNIMISCVWLVSVGVMFLTLWVNVPFSMITAYLLSVTSVAFCFCSLSVLCALIGPGPGEGGGNRRCTDQSKQRAFHTMIIITAVISLCFISNLIVCIYQNTSDHHGFVYCVTGWSSVWFLVPSSLVLPLLFLQREGKLPGCGPKSDESIKTTSDLKLSSFYQT